MRAVSWALTLAIGASFAAASHAQPAPRREKPAAAAAPVDALAGLLARTDAVAREVARVRGLPLKRSIPNEVVDREELRRRLLAIAAEAKTKAETAAEGLALARWGMIPFAADYEALLIELLTEQIAGYYDPDTKKLTISKSAGDDAQWAELVLAHEIDHGLQDQAFDLKKFEDVPDIEDDARAARRALVEGDGVALMLEVMLARRGAAIPWSNPQVTDAIEKAMVAPGHDDLDRAPLAVREAMIFPYRAGFMFVAALRRRQPWSAIDAAFARPPRSTEQILHPERYLADDRPIPIEVAVPPSLRGFAIAHETVWGELGFQLFLRSHGVDAATAEQAAAGWGGDRAVVLARGGDRRPERATGISRSEWDTEADAIEAEEALVKALDEASTGTLVEATTTRTRWFGIDGTVSWIERRGPSIAMVIGAPAWAATALATEVWTGSRIAAPAAAPARAPKR
ncbi:MAG TPA: hypothetical protein VN253_30065 [Kofleriaceae bacterium]|nr:hypothetical protein [Kofleriaceae bacterium]